MSVYDDSLANLDGTGNVLDAAKGKVSLFVNVASKCGLTPQYTELEALQKQYGGDDFTVVGFPCNQFMGQEPGTSEEIAEFCSSTYGVTFPLSEKIDVNGDDRNPLYAELTQTADAEGVDGDIRWNFEKFLVNRSGDVVARFAPQVTPDDPAVVSAIEAALA
jgi:glutathione peroxidase